MAPKKKAEEAAKTVTRKTVTRKSVKKTAKPKAIGDMTLEELRTARMEVVVVREANRKKGVNMSKELEAENVAKLKRFNALISTKEMSA